MISIKIPHRDICACVCIRSCIFFKLDKLILKFMKFLGFPGGTVVENPPANAGDMGTSPGLGRSHMLRSN